jgi:hypothetical protein
MTTKREPDFDRADLDAADAVVAAVPVQHRAAVRTALADAYAMGMVHGVRYTQDPAARYVNPYRPVYRDTDWPDRADVGSKPTG